MAFRRVLVLIAAGLLGLAVLAPAAVAEARTADLDLAGPGLAQAPSSPVEHSAGFLMGVAARQYLADAAEDPLIGCTSELTLTSRIGQTLMPGSDWADLPELTRYLAEGLIGGLVVLGTPPASIDLTIAELRGVASVDPLVAVDEEGGRVQRLRKALGVLPSAADQASENSPDQLREIVADHGEAVRALGFDMNLAPVLDVGGGPGIGDRAFSDEPALVIEYGLAVAAGLEDAGLMPVVKHFPGHGRASVDTHLDLATTPALDELEVIDLAPFRAAISSGVGAVMVGHLDVPGLTNGVPATLSPEAVAGLLRDDLEFDGLIMSDAMNMGAITNRWSTAEAVELALRAGIDVVLLGDAEEIDAVHAHLAEAVDDGRLSETRLTRAAAKVLHAKGLNACVIGAGRRG